MATLSRARSALRSAYRQLPQRDAITDVAYLLDVDPYGAECLVVYITRAHDCALDASSKRAVEAALRDALAKVLPHSSYFRWQTDSEAKESRREVTLKGALIDQPHSALRKAS